MVVSGDLGMPNCTDRDTLMSEAEVAAVAEVAHAHGRLMNAHARSAESIKRCVRHGVHIIYHANFADDEALDLLEAHKERVFVSPNIGFPAVAVHEGSTWDLTDEDVEKLGFREELEGACEVMIELHKRGVKVLGFTPIEAIMSMTRYCGEAMGLPNELGQIKEGFLADILLVRGDPLADPKVLLDCENLAAIMKDGDFHKEPVTTRELATLGA